MGLGNGPDESGSFPGLLWMTVHTPWCKPILSTSCSHTLVFWCFRARSSLQLSEFQNPQSTQVGDLPPFAKPVSHRVCARPHIHPQEGDSDPSEAQQPSGTWVQVCTGTGARLGAGPGAVGRSGLPACSREGPESQQAVLWVRSPSAVSGPPDGGQQGGCLGTGPLVPARTPVAQPAHPLQVPLPGTPQSPPPPGVLKVAPLRCSTVAFLVCFPKMIFFS